MELIEIVKALAGMLLGVLAYFAKKSHDDIAALKEAMAALELKCAEHYVGKPEMEALTKAIFAKLDRIEDKIDKKADKQ
jgi:hypothetical protein